MHLLLRWRIIRNCCCSMSRGRILIRPSVKNSIIFLREFTADGTKSVILSTHITSDVDRFADYLLLLKKGRQLLYGDIESVRDAYRMVAGERHALRAFGGRLVYMEETPVGCSALVKHDHAEYDRALKVWEPDTEELMYYLAKGAEHGRGNQI